jgi:CBS domain-containing protein
MLRYSLPLGRFFGVDLRMHISFPVLLVLCIVLSESINGVASRGVALWLALCFAVFVREAARAVAAAYIGLELHGLFLLPVGGIMAFIGVGAERDTAANRRLLMLSGPLANLLIGLLLLGTAYALEPKVSLLALPWIDTSHILRSFVWLQLMLGALSLLPMPAVAASRRAAREARAKDAEIAVRTGRKSFPITVPRISLGVLVAVAVIVLGVVLMNLGLAVLGVFVLLFVILSRPPAISGPEAESLLVREVMLTEYTLLSSSDTLRGALERTLHSLQDVFPVVRGDHLVGSVARQTITSRLITDGDSYLQGVMTKTLQVATPSEKLVEALSRTASLGASEFIPVVEDGAMVGILTPSSLGRAVQQIKHSRPTSTREKARD